VEIGHGQQLVALAGRAEATRQALMRSGIVEDRFRRIEGSLIESC
jgi:hypothetical protein